MGRAFEFRKARKMKRWSKMSKIFTRVGRQISMAVKEGGGDPESNSKLRAVIQTAKDANMPKENIARAIKKASEKDSAAFKEVLFEGYAPHGVAILVETASDNNNRTVANIRSYFSKNNGSLGTQGSVSFMFDHKCHFKINQGEQDLEELEFELIDYGVEELFAEENHAMIYGNFENFGSLQSAIEEKGIEIMASGFERFPQTTKKLTVDQEKDVDKLLQIFDDDDDVINVFHNMEYNETEE